MASAAEQLAANLKFDTFRKAKDLHKRILFTLGALIVYRFGTYVPLPGIDPAAFSRLYQGNAQGILGVFNMFSGGAVERMAVFALNVMPYITASIVVQIVGTMYPPWEKLRKEGGEAGRTTLNQYTRYLTIIVALFQAFTIAAGLQSSPGMVSQPGLVFMITTVATLTGGTMLLMWLGEQVTSRGLGNGVSLIIFAGIIAAMPGGIWRMVIMAKVGSLSALAAPLLAGLALAVTLFVVFMERSQRRLLLQYPRGQQVVRNFGGERTFLPLKVNTSGVMAPIFASSLLLLPTTVLGALATVDLPAWLAWLPDLGRLLQHGQPAFMVLYGVLIVFFCFFYTSIMFNPDEVAENLRKFGGFLQGVRPGKDTASHLDFVMTRVTVIGAIYITLVCVIPELLIGYYRMPFYLGGTSILIVISVTMDTVSAMQAQMVSHQYEQVIRGARIRRPSSPMPPPSRPVVVDEGGRQFI
jgi:preprotein translocase subunit SecY